MVYLFSQFWICHMIGRFDKVSYWWKSYFAPFPDSAVEFIQKYFGPSMGTGYGCLKN